MKLSSTSNKKFFSSYKTIVDNTPIFEDKTAIYISILLGPNKDTYTRTVYTIMDLFGNIGGIYGLLHSACEFFVGFISYQIMLSSVFQRLYFINRFDNDSSSSQLDLRKIKINKIPEESKYKIPRTRIFPMFNRQDDSKSLSDVNIQLNNSSICS